MISILEGKNMAVTDACFYLKGHVLFRLGKRHPPCRFSTASNHPRHLRLQCLFNRRQSGTRSKYNGSINDDQLFKIKFLDVKGDSDLQTNVSLPDHIEASEEKVDLNMIPQHPEAVQGLYLTYIAACFMERAWRFMLPAILAQFCESLLPVAVVSFSGQILIVAGGPIVGAILDSVPRVLAFNIMTFTQTISMLVSAGMLVYGISKEVVISSAAASLMQPWFLILIVAGGLERLSGLATGVAFERDWVVLLAGSDRSIALANANATLRRVDLICEVVGPFLFGILLSTFHPVTCVLIASVAITLSFPISILLVMYTYKASKGALDRADIVKQPPSSFHILKLPGLGLMEGWRQYLVQPVLPASIAYILLYCNNVLAPSGLMTSFLTQKGLNPSLIGAYRGMCAVMGFLSTFLVTHVITRVGLLKAGAFALTFQASLLVAAVLVFLIGSPVKQASLSFFLVLVVLSRLGHWAYDMADAQIFQMAIPTSKANLLGTTEMSLASVAELLMLGVAIVVNDVSHFGFLATLSMLAVVLAAWIYWNWLLNPTEFQKRLFSEDSSNMTAKE